MELISVIVAAAAGYGFGAFWYMSLSKQWVDASGIAVDAEGKPANKSMAPFVKAGVAMLVVAGMMRHVFGMSGIDSFGAGLVGGFGLGAFIALPWIVTNYAYSDRPKMLTYIDGGYAVLGSSIIGAVLGLF
ncbi:hypothetical protein DEA8626_02569 [Defluviimonas aquaemixtae]|uniref:DUF1761 domain-containing protein n=1 Tax=Albidovulum aquaemixtae TaxID=1542388 RepID=A0A2R8BJC1_9RHOB|nr:DUF1761 domain-containing protein [Defluviimonas aquaemixtae]SPH23505.1 hypothetical protein DEA8626_02569 [Defluviimonas aquaemixtae]